MPMIPSAPPKVDHSLAKGKHCFRCGQLIGNLHYTRTKSTGATQVRSSHGHWMVVDTSSLRHLKNVQLETARPLELFKHLVCPKN